MSLGIVSFRSENYKVLKVVEIVPAAGESTIVLRGPNGSGKSTILDAIESTLNGGQQAECPIRNGQHEAINTIKLADPEAGDRLTVTRKFWHALDKDGNPVIRDKFVVAVNEGFAGPRMTEQAMLDMLAGAEGSFDPSEMLRLKPQELGARVQKLVGLDFSALNKEHDGLFGDRTKLKASIKSKGARLAAMPAASGATRVEVSELLKEQAKIGAERERITSEHAAGVAKLRQAERDQEKKADGSSRAVRDALQSKAVATARVTAADLAVADLEQKIENARLATTTARALLVSIDAAIGPARNSEAEDLMSLDLAHDAVAVASGAKLDLPSLENIVAQIAGAEAVNAQVASDATRSAIESEVATEAKDLKRTQDRMDAIVADRTEQLAAAKFPVAGMGFNADGVTMNGLPLEQEGGAGKLRAVMAIGIASTKRLKIVRIHELSVFDNASLLVIDEMAKAAGAQIWGCTPAEGPTGFEIIGGEVASFNGLPVARPAPKPLSIVPARVSL